ncbi:small subunit ribosomal protein S1 [Vibrio gazogenes DSM 21264]|uniref:Small ribosomal subunit protein bS1 n=1 Tax=Vibrio gazogenes DSM 21264 = NBRC 103151 TaxID=1123492 RepID=A0A1M5HD02_VIBGA|nr:30S ribosomal protein S1 [Vibrio gazogenes]SHG13833.1 small subunit ribosomal protein S1 [Vibrio gazogenes DSM 21264] [Vibrio gazogenes DSM 21264 = NBRC 103151]SJN54170.1 30S ribosomal protein S1 [Vibrio gazogenes]
MPTIKSIRYLDLLDRPIQGTSLQSNIIVKGTVVAIENGFVLVDIGLKSESAIPAEQFKNAAGELEVEVGSEVDVALDAVEDGFGETQLSREKAKRHEAWIVLGKAYEEGETVVGIINGKVKGGFTVGLINGIRAYLPASLVDVRSIRDTAHLENKELEFKVIKLDQKRNNVVVSRRSVIESESSVEREELLETLREGAEVKVIVKNLTDYGAVVDLSGVDGLLHITDMAWKRVKHPSEIVNVGDEILVKVLNFNRERTRVSLGLKQLGEDPWVAIAKRYPEGHKLTGSVTNLIDYGCFVEIEEGVEGLVHVSEMDWTNKNIQPSKVVNVGDEVEVMVLEIDEERRRISLGLKQCKTNPWESFAKTHVKGDKVTGMIKSITDYGMLIGLEGGIEGLVHLSDISCDATSEGAIPEYNKGDEISTFILSIDADRERISLGINQEIKASRNRGVYIEEEYLASLSDSSEFSFLKPIETSIATNICKAKIVCNEKYTLQSLTDFLNKEFSVKLSVEPRLGEDVKLSILAGYSTSKTIRSYGFKLRKENNSIEIFTNNMSLLDPLDSSAVSDVDANKIQSHGLNINADKIIVSKFDCLVAIFGVINE